MDDLSSRIPNKKLAIAVLAIAIFSFIAFVMLVFSLVGGTNFLPNQNAPTASPTPAPTETDVLKVDYSSINKIVPGKTNFADAQKINGKADSIVRKDGKTYLYYKTPTETNQNVVVVENNIVVYSTEYVYGSYRKNVAEFKAEFGEPDLILYDGDDSYPWDIFLNRGVGIKNDGQDVGEIVYFVPQNEQGFLENIASELKLSPTPPDEL